MAQAPVTISCAGSIETAAREVSIRVRNFVEVGQWELGIDTRGNVIYDASGLPTEVVDAEGGVTRFGYDADGLMLWQRSPIHDGLEVDDPSWARTEFGYDSFGRLGLQSSPKDAAHEPGELIWSAATYDPDDNLVTSFGPVFGREFTPGPVWGTKFDAMDRPVETTSPNTEVDPDGARTQTEYDTAGRPVVVREPEAVLSGDGQGWATSQTLPPTPDRG